MLIIYMYRPLDFSVHNHTMLQAACCLGFFGFFHTVNSPFDPAIHLTVNDIQTDLLFNTSSFRIHIKFSKMDPFHQRCYIYIDSGKQDLFPVRALVQYLHLRGSNPGPLFLLSDDTPLTRQWLASSIRSIFSSAGVLGCFSGHSFHIDAATSAASCGVPDHLIKTLGRRPSDA